MKQYQTEAILLAVRDWSAADRVVTLFSREYGKLMAMAYGVRRTRNSLSGSIQPFMHLDVYLSSGKNMETIKQCEVKNSFRKIRDNLECMAYSSFVAEIVSELCPEHQPEPKVFDLLIHVFSLITDRNPRLVALAGAWQLLSLTGYQPECQNCVLCGQKLNFPAYFDASSGGGVCRTCHHSGCLEFSQASSEFIEQLLSLDLEEPGHFIVGGATMLQSETIITAYLLYCVDKPLKSLSFIKQLM
jgi:DNA repair protein RecO (recombination protein O)